MAGSPAGALTLPLASEMRGERCHEDSVQQGPGQLFSPGFRREPVRLVLRYVRCRSDVCRIGRHGLFDPPEQVSNSRNFREVLLGNPKSQNALEFEAQVQPFQRVDAEIELWVRVQRQAARRISGLQDAPRRRRFRLHLS